MRKSKIVIFCSLLCLSFNAQTFIRGGFASSSSGSPRSLINVNGTLFFQVDDGINGDELWKSDGTTAGTVMVKDITPGSNGTNFSLTLKAVMNNELYFSVATTAEGYELWKSDGTASGTFLLKDIDPGSNSSWPGDNQANTTVSDFEPSNGTLFFPATTTANGRELWKSDGTAAGTVLVKDIMPGASGSDVKFLCDVNGVVYFSAYNSANGQELWKSDGTAAGTMLVKDINPGTASSFPNFLINVNGTLFFLASNGVNGNELWKSDGTAAGTVMVKDINPGSSESNPSVYGPAYMVNGNGILYFFATDGSTGYELWKSDGTTAGTTLVKDINAGTATSMSTGTGGPLLRFINNALYFRASNGVNGQELWISDGTTSGTTMVKDIFSGSNGSTPRDLAELNSACYFVAAGPSSFVSQLYKSDGTAAGTYSLFISASDPYPSDLTNVNGTLFFRANSNINGEGLWKLDPNVTSLTDRPNIAEHVNLFPNPSDGKFIIDIQNDTNIEITNSLGETLITQHIQKGRNEINMSNQCNGIYFIKANHSTFKIIKQ